jgi:hypothetical protein
MHHIPILLIPSVDMDQVVCEVVLPLLPKHHEDERGLGWAEDLHTLAQTGQSSLLPAAPAEFPGLGGKLPGHRHFILAPLPVPPSAGDRQRS